MKKKIVLIDGNSLVYRAFFALPTTLATSKGQVTNAVYGFTSMLIKLLKEEKPDIVIAAFDRAAPTFRHEEFEEYKAHRQPAPDELRSQFPFVQHLVDHCGDYQGKRLRPALLLLAGRASGSLTAADTS